MTLLLILVILRAIGGQVESPAETPARVEPAPVASARQPSVTATLSGGERFNGMLDPRTDEEALWLLWVREGIELRRPIAWDSVQSATVGQLQLTGGELRQVVARIRSEAAPENPFVPESPIVLTGVADGGSRARSPMPPEAGVPRRVRSLAVDVYAGRWTGNVESDGLIVEVLPLDERGRLVAVDGTLEVRLIAQRTGGNPPQYPMLGAGHWSHRVRASDFGTDPAAYRCEFQGVHPEFSRDLLARGAVLCRLSVPGQGTFDATAASVRLRPYSSVRDNLQLSTGQRFFPEEATRDGRR